MINVEVEVEVLAEDGLSGEIWKFFVHSEREMRASYFARVSRPRQSPEQASQVVSTGALEPAKRSHRFDQEVRALFDA